MLDLFSGSAYALESRYYNLAKARIIARLDKGLPALSAAEVKPRHYAHVDADGYPTMFRVAVEPAQPSLLAAIGARVSSSSTTRGAAGSQVAVIPVQGTVQKRGGYCSTGTKQLASYLAQANQDADVSAIVLDIDSPGGAVDGTEEFANLVASSKKPVVSYIDGLGASAAYWIAAGSQHIVINSATTGYAGSLGVLCSHVSQTAALEKQGAKVTILRSSRAVDKARMNGVEELTPELQASVIADLDRIAETFIGHVEAGRAGKLSSKEDVFTGKVYAGRDALKHGLVDQIGSFQDAISKAAQLAREGSGASASALTTQLNQRFK